MKKTNVPTILYLIVALLGGGFLLIAGGNMPLYWLGGMFLIPPVTFAALRRLPFAEGVALLVAAGFLCTMLAPSVGLAALLFVLWYGSALILQVATRMTPDLFPILLYGGALFGAFTLMAGCLVIRDIYGVFDLFAPFRSLQELLVEGLELLTESYQRLLPENQWQELLPQLEMLRDNVEVLAYQILTFGATVLMLFYFYALKVGQRLVSDSPKPVVLTPLWLYTVPREIARAYIVLYVVSFFTLGTVYESAINLANSVMGYLFVLVGIGWIDAKMHRKKAAFRTLIKCLLLLLAVVSDSFLTGMAYTVLCVIGVMISLFRRVIIRRNPETK